jgi:hypothetical protein
MTDTITMTDDAIHEKDPKSEAVIDGTPSLKQSSMMWSAKPFQSLSRQVMGLLFTVLVAMRIKQEQERNHQTKTKKSPSLLNLAQVYQRPTKRSVRFDMSGSLHNEKLHSNDLDKIPDIEQTNTDETDPLEGEELEKEEMLTNKRLCLLVASVIVGGGSLIITIFAFVRFMLLGESEYPTFQ